MPTCSTLRCVVVCCRCGAVAAGPCPAGCMAVVCDDRLTRRGIAELTGRQSVRAGPFEGEQGESCPFPSFPSPRLVKCCWSARATRTARLCGAGCSTRSGAVRCGSIRSKAPDGTTCTAVTYRHLSRAEASCRRSPSWRTSLSCTAGTGRCWWTWRRCPGAASGSRQPGSARSWTLCWAARSRSTTWCATWTDVACTRGTVADRPSPRRRRRRAGPSRHCPPPARPCWSELPSTTRGLARSARRAGRGRRRRLGRLGPGPG